MAFLIPAISAVLQATSFTLDKVVLSIKKVTYKTYVGISFPLIFIFTLIIFLIFRPDFSLSLFSGKYLILILISIILAIATNLIFYSTLKNEHLSEMQTIDLLRNIPLIIFAAIFFKSERSFVIFLALIASMAVVWSHWQKGHFKIARRTLPFLLWTLIVTPFAGIISKIILEIWNPISLQLVVNGAVAIIFLFIYTKNIEKVPKQAIPYLIATNLLTTVAWILYFFSYKNLGITYTLLVFSLQPFLVYLASLIFLKEKFHWKKFAAFIIILVAIAISQILG